jgi:hypothetical protein
LDPLIKSQLLYQLSYAPSEPGISGAGGALDIKPVRASKEVNIPVREDRIGR